MRRQKRIDMKPQTPKMKRPKRKGHESLNHQNEEAQNRQLKAQKGQPKGSKVTKAGNERKDMTLRLGPKQMNPLQRLELKTLRSKIFVPWRSRQLEGPNRTGNLDNVGIAGAVAGKYSNQTSLCLSMKTRAMLLSKLPEKRCQQLGFDPAILCGEQKRPIAVTPFFSSACPASCLGV